MPRLPPSSRKPIWLPLRSPTRSERCLLGWKCLPAMLTKILPRMCKKCATRVGPMSRSPKRRTSQRCLPSSIGSRTPLVWPTPAMTRSSPQKASIPSRRIEVPNSWNAYQEMAIARDNKGYSQENLIHLLQHRIIPHCRLHPSARQAVSQKITLLQLFFRQVQQMFMMREEDDLGVPG